MNKSYRLLDHFPADYFAARERFLSLATRAGAQVASHPIAARGPGGRALSIDTAYLGAAEPRRLLIVLSATHGVEGFAGSALQQQWLDRGVPELPADGGCLLIHAVNPYGFAWRRRTNEHNVDLNRNALERFPGPANPAYGRLDGWLNPPSPPRFDGFLLRGVFQLLRHGAGVVQRAILEGQYEYPRGLFYGGARTEASIEVVLALLAAERFRGAERIVALDLHTGFGRYGSYTLMVDLPTDAPRYADLVRWFGKRNVASSQVSGSIAYPISGGLTQRIMQTLAPVSAHAALLEFGTYGPARVLAALRRENRAYHYAGIESEAHARAAAALEEMFCPRDPAWRERVLSQGMHVIGQAARACFHESHVATAPAHRPTE